MAIYSYSWEGLDVKRQRVWIDTLPFVSCSSDESTQQSFNATYEAELPFSRIAIEVFLPSGPGALYGLLGAELKKVDSKELQVMICSQSVSQPFDDGFPTFNNNPRSGFPKGAEQFVFEGIKASSHLPQNVAITFNCAAHGNYTGVIVYQFLATGILNLISIPFVNAATIASALGFGDRWMLDE